MLRVDYGVKSQGTVWMERLGILILTCLLLLPVMPQFRRGRETGVVLILRS